MEKNEGQRVNDTVDTSTETRVEPELRLESKDALAVVEASEPVQESAVDTPAAEIAYITGWKLFLATGIVALASFTLLLDTSIIVTAIPRITSDFHSLNDVGWYGSAYLLSSSSLQPLTGKLYTQFNTKFTYLTFLGLFELGSLICGVAQNSKMLIVGRAVAGMGASGLSNGGLTVIASVCSPQKRPVLLGFLIGFAQLGILIGPILGGVLTQYTTWRWCFFINLPIGAFVAVCLFLIHIPNQTAGKVHLERTLKSIFHVFDIGGFLLFAPTMIMFLLALEWGGSVYTWNSATIIGLFCGAAGNLLLFLAWEHKKGNGAMLPLGMIKRTVVWCSSLVTFFFGGALLITSYYLAIYFQAVGGRSPTMSGIDVLPGIIATLFAGVIAGILVSRVGYYLPYMLISGILNAIGCGLIATWNPHTSTAKWIGDQILASIGRGMGLQMPIVAVTNVLTPAENPIGMALMIFCQNFGGSIWLAIASTTFSSGLSSALKKFAPGVDASAVIEAGATGYKDIVPKEAVDGVVRAYSEATNEVFYVAAGCAVAYTLFASGMGTASIKKNDGAKVGKENGEGAV